MIWSDSITPRDRQIVDDLVADPARINAIEYAAWIERPEIQHVLGVLQHLRAKGARQQADGDWRFAVDAVKATIAANKNLDDPVQRRQTLQAATTILRFATAILTGDLRAARRRPDRHDPDPFPPLHHPRGTQSPRDSINHATSNGTTGASEPQTRATQTPTTRFNEPEAPARVELSTACPAPSRNGSPATPNSINPHLGAPPVGLAAPALGLLAPNQRAGTRPALAALKRSPANLVAAAGAPGPAP